MKRHIRLAFCALFAGAALGQAPATKIGSHQMGETVAQWYSTENISVEDVCPQIRKHRRGTCVYADVRNTGEGTLNRNTGINVTNDDPFSWRFSGGKLVEVAAEYRNPNTEQQIEWLTAKYGVPESKDAVTYQNGFGAQWVCQRVIWHMPDGSGIMAQENIQSLKRWLLVSLYLFTGPTDL